MTAHVSSASSVQETAHSGTGNGHSSGHFNPTQIRAYSLRAAIAANPVTTSWLCLSITHKLFSARKGKLVQALLQLMQMTLRSMAVL